MMNMGHALFEQQVRELRGCILSLRDNHGQQVYTDAIYADKLACYIVSGEVLLTKTQMGRLVSNEHDRGAQPIDGK